MSINIAERMAFKAEWYDKVASRVRNFNLYFFPADNSVELVDPRTRKLFLRRTKCELIEAKDLYVGGMVTIFSRAMKITDTADDATKNKLETSMQKTLGTIKPDAINRMGEILKLIINHDLHISNIKMVRLSEDEVDDFYKTKSETHRNILKRYMTSGPVLAFELMGDHALTRFQELVGPTDSQKAREKAPTSLRACYGKDSTNNSIHASEDNENAEKEIQFFFPDAKSKRTAPRNTATFKNCTCCIIKPHAIHAGLTGQIIQRIQKADFNITAIEQFLIDPVNAEEFLEVYKGVLPEYNDMVAELQSGPCIALEISHSDETVDVHGEFRKLCGPMDPDIARQVRPETLRAQYGKSKVQNAIHCSDLPEDGLLEVEYFFKILADG